MKFNVGKLDVLVLIPTVSLDFRFKRIALTILVWTFELTFN